MIQLNLPDYHFRFKKDAKQRPCIFDFLRKKWLVLTPEEWVRQNWLKLLVEELNYPPSIIQIESGLTLHERKKRSDVLIYKNSVPILLIECKAPSVTVSAETIIQANNYNQVYKAKYMVLTNGLKHYVLKRTEDRWEELKMLPSYENL